MIPSATTLPQTPLEAEEKLLDLEDPFIGVLGQGSPKDNLWLGKTVPRYTSYPPATAFREDVTAQDYKAALMALPPEEPVSLYVHVPFCRALCLYCGCNTTPTQHHERVTTYLEFMHRELDRLALTSSRARRIGRIHFGGGSPNLLSEKDLGLMFGALVRRFDLSACRETAMELDPRLITKAQVRALRLTGVNRVSLGIQDFDPEVQSAIGRVQPHDMIARACDMLRDDDVDNLNFDLLYGLPFQSPVTMAATARKAVELKPRRIALFSYAHVPQVKKHQKLLEQYVLPGPHAALALEKAARDVFREAGYVEIGMDHFALPEDSLAKAQTTKTLRRGFQGYTDDATDTLVGVGASSIGLVGAQYFQNARTAEAYQERIVSHGFATVRGLRLHEEDRLRAAVIESLMCYLSVNLEQVCRSFNYSLSALSAEIEALKPYEDAGIIRREGYKISLAIPHRMAIRVIASVFDTTQRDKDAPVSRVV